MNSPDYYLLALSTEKNRFIDMELASFIKIVFIKNENEKIELEMVNGEKLDVGFLLTISHLILGRVTWENHSNEAFEKLIPKLPVSCAHNLCLAKNQPLSNSSKLLAIWIQEQLQYLAARFAGEVVKLQRSLIATRQAHERTQLAFSSLENYILHHAPAASRISFSADQTAYYYPEDFTAAPVSASQVLPVSSQGFSGIEIFFAVPERKVSGHITISVTTRESETVLGIWTVEFSHLREGWNLFSLSETPNNPSESLLLQINWQPASEGLMPGTALSWHQPMNDYRLKFNSNDTPPLRSLAFRCVSYLPGLRMPTMLDAFYPNSPKPKKLMRAKYKSTFQATVLVSGNGPTTAQLVQPLDGGSRLLVHPPAEGVTIALLSVDCPKEVARISASVKTENKDASDICYSIALVPKNTDFSNIMKVFENPQSLTGFSGWHVVKAGMEASVHLMTRPLIESQHILLMTKLPPGASIENAWATFQDLEFFSETVETA
ncbi:hypothetical protein ABIB42_000703 [Massilia sp. UYP32]|uniref:DUF6212 domain-containing protein n=1 Tax=Massilia sp. UYP32 TaxID=1756386 RepID=UPI003D1D46CB